MIGFSLPPALVFCSLGLNLVGILAVATYVRRKGGLQYLKSLAAAKGLKRDRKLENFEAAYRRTRVEIFALFPPGPTDLVMLGDSLSELGPWQDLLGLSTVRAQGIGGDTVPGLIARVGTLGTPRMVALLVGVNDLNHGQTVDALLADYERLLAAIATQAPSARVLVQAILPLDAALYGTKVQARIQDANRGLEALARARGHAWLDLHAIFHVDGGLDPHCTYDGLHLNATGYRRWAAALAPLVRG